MYSLIVKNIYSYIWLNFRVILLKHKYTFKRPYGIFRKLKRKSEDRMKNVEAIAKLGFVFKIILNNS